MQNIKRIEGYEYKLPAVGNDPAANLALFLLLNTGSIFGHFIGTIRANDQRALYGKSYGRKQLAIDGTTETVSASVACCFGYDRETVDGSTFAGLVL